MNIGIFPGWLLAAVIARWIGGFPTDLCVAGASIGMGLSLAAVARSSKALSPALAPLTVLLLRYALIRDAVIVGRAAQDQDWLVHYSQLLASPSALILISLLSMVTSWLVGMRWVYQGEA